jgi:DNA-binding MarR family transcriptional regulator
MRRRAASTVPWLLRRVNQRYRRAIRGELEEAGLRDLPQRGYWALTSLATEARNASDLTREMGVTKQAVSQLVDTLVAAGYVDRQPNQADRRRTVLLLTTKGRRAVDVIESAVRATERHFIVEVGADSFDQLREVLGRLALVPISRRDSRASAGPTTTSRRLVRA